MSYSRSNSKLNNTYHLFEKHIKKITFVRDLGLGVTFQSNLSFSAYIENIYTKALRCLGFITRNTKDFNNKLCLNTLYTYLVRRYINT